MLGWGDAVWREDERATVYVCGCLVVGDQGKSLWGSILAGLLKDDQEFSRRKMGGKGEERDRD